ncbi:MAG: hypothetical protein ABF868_01350 [Sporolactobacillus sp.]
MIDINLLPYEEKASKATIWLIAAAAAVCLIAVITFAGYTLHLSQQLSRTQALESQWQQRAAKLRKTAVPTQPLPSSKQLSQADAVLQVKTARIPVYETLLSAEHQLPLKSDTLEQATFDATGNTTIQCGVDSYNEMRQYVNNLRAGVFKNVVLMGMTEQTGASANAYNVSLSMTSAANQAGGQ